MNTRNRTSRPPRAGGAGGCLAARRPLIDECVTRYGRAGAYGAKLTGSGHGGCLFALASLDTLGPVVAALRDLPVRVTVFTTGDPHGVVFPPADF
jgi:galactokinase/mevalonate kinase-like predicted kinase